MPGSYKSTVWSKEPDSILQGGGQDKLQDHAPGFHTGEQSLRPVGNLWLLNVTNHM